MNSGTYYKFLSTFATSQFEIRKLLGQFYTDYTVTDELNCRILETESSIWSKQQISVVDPFCGDGRLIANFIKLFSKKEKNTNTTLEIHIWDVDPIAINTAREIIDGVAKEYGVRIQLYNNSVCDTFVMYRGYKNYFDICITNPPWGLLKPLKMFNKRCSEDDLNTYKDCISNYDQYMQEEFKLSKPEKKFGKWGTNLGRCGLEVALKLISTDGICGFVSPASLFNDQVSVNLRKWIIESFHLSSISYYPAELKLYGSADVSSITAVASVGFTESIFIREYDKEYKTREKQFNNESLRRCKAFDYAIPLEVGSHTLDLEMKFDSFPTLKSYCDDHNLIISREIDETGYREKVSSSGEIVFAKGYMVDRFKFSSDNLFLKPEINLPLSYNKSKIAWRDVSRTSQIRRIKATILNPPSVAGNSLGIIYSRDNDVHILENLLGIINSYVFEFQARMKLVSNHVPSGILKKLRIPFGEFESIGDISRKILQGENLSSELEVCVAISYGLSLEEFETILNTFIISDEDRKSIITCWKTKYPDKGEKHMIPNHYAAKLSNLDMQIVKCVPPGGNWKNIPETIPSQRLSQIRESYRQGKGSRSTYYGRLLPNKPSYTINTYFNRPGNGCHIHYCQDRTISQREAARLQSFPDSFVFKGPLTAVNNQIGNAVPPLLAYQIAKAIPFKGQFIDLFAGAGGLALGFVWAGWKPIIANDIDKYSLETHKANIQSRVVVGDINDEDVFTTIVNAAHAAKRENPELPLFVLGGPPCQGFSTANARRGAADMRNWLFKSYLRVVKTISPEGFVFENVKGITNMEGGKFFEMIKSEFKDCGLEAIKVTQVNSADYAIPQRRERVIIIGGSSNLVDSCELVLKTSLYKDDQIKFLPDAISVSDAIDDLPELQHSEDGSAFPYKKEPTTLYQKFMRGLVAPEEYLSHYCSS